MPKPTHHAVPPRVEVLPHGCPICDSEVRGNPRLNYYCRKCEVLFRLEDCKQ